MVDSITIIIPILVVGLVIMIVGIFLYLKSKKKEKKGEDLTVNNPAVKIDIPVAKETPKGSIPKPLSKKKEITNREGVLFQVEEAQIPTLPASNNPKEVDIRYPLIPPYAYASIKWDNKNSELVYNVEEPVLTVKEADVLRTLEKGIGELINLSFISSKDKFAILAYLEKNIKVLLTELSITINMDTFLKVMYYIYRDFVGLNEIEPFMNDYFIEDVECNGLNTPIYIVHRKYGNVRTNIVYKDIHAMTTFVEKLAQKTGRYVSYAEPLLDGTLPDGSVDYGEPLIYKENGTIKILKIGKFIDRYYKKDESNNPVNVENIEVPAFDNKDLKIKWRKIDYVYRHKNEGKLFEVCTEAGRKVRLTGAHSVFVLKKDGITAEKVENLSEGDYVVTPKSIPNGSMHTIKFNLAKELSKTSYYPKFILREVPKRVFIDKKDALMDYYKENYKRPNQAYYEHKKKRIIPIKLYKLLKKNFLEKCTIGSTSPVKLPVSLNINKDIARLIGYYIAEGWMSKQGNRYGVYFSIGSHEKEFLRDLQYIAKRYFNVTPYLDRTKPSEIKVFMCGLTIWLIFKEILKVTKYARSKRVPEVILNSPEDIQEEFLRGWHIGDYSSTSSKGLAEDVQYLGLMLGKTIPFYLRERDGVIEGREVHSKEFYSNFLARNETKYHEMIPISPFNPLNNTNEEFSNKKISRDRLKNILSHKRYKYFMDLPNAKNKKLFTEWSKRDYVHKIDDCVLLTRKGQNTMEEYKTVQKMISSDLNFLRINKINRVIPKKEFVYDVSVPGCENFVSGFGGLCCHNSRVNATYTTDVSSRGPTFSIRKFTREPWSPLELVKKGTISLEMLSYAWMCIEYEYSFMVIGGTGSGKTTLLNALAFFIPPQSRIVSIEDTRELQLYHENWLPSVARAGVGMSNLVGQKSGEVGLFDLLKASFRQRPDFIIVGEIRGKEAYVLFQAFASGHPGCATMHAEDVNTMIRRLETAPINLSGSLVMTLSAVFTIEQTKVKGKNARKVNSMDEIIEVKENLGGANTNNVFKWNPAGGTFSFNPNSIVFDKIATHYGYTKEDVVKEYQARVALLRTLYNRGITGFKEVQEVIYRYYKDPQGVLKQYGVI